MNNNQYRKTAITVALSLAGLSLMPRAIADDTEIFFASNQTNVPANVLFILDTSTSMKDELGGKAKLDILKDSLKSILAENYPGLNVGIMHFGYKSSGPDFPIANLDALSNTVDPAIPNGRTVRETLGHIIDSYGYNSTTAIVPSLYEAYRYFDAKDVYAGKLKPKTWDETNKKYSGDQWASHPAAYAPFDAWKENQSVVAGDYCYVTDPNNFLGYSLSCSNQTLFPNSCVQYDVGAKSKTSCSGNYDYIVNGETGSWVCNGTVTTTYNTQALEYCRLPKNAGGFNPDPVYKTPIAYPCQDNYIVLLSDGKPTTSNSSVNSNIASMIYGTTDFNNACKNIQADTDAGINTNGRCGIDLLEAMNDTDKNPKLPMDKNITTYTIGFDLGGDVKAKKYLQMLAAAGGGKYSDANSSQQLVDQFKNILSAISKANTSFSAPTFSISQSNKLSYANDVYLTMFEPSSSPRWEGNIKGYQIQHEGIFDVNSNLAVDATGQFIDSARSYWSSAVDGGNVLAGGVASKLNTIRKVYTYTGAGTPGSPVDITASSHTLSKANTNLTNAIFGLPAGYTQANREKLIDWAKGIDVNDENSNGDITDARKQMGDPLHSQPVVLSYANNTRKVMYNITNDGYLHAFDVTGNGTTYGKEIFSFIPKELLPNLKALMDNQEGQAKVYGLDGHLVGWNNGNKSYLYFGMRRGGSNYYAMDVTNPDKPKLMWVIQGGVTPGFEKLGQTWSLPAVLRVKRGAGNPFVVAFGGGYDINQDSVKTRVETADTVGNHIYMVDAFTGTPVWTAGPGGNLTIPFTHSIPSELRAIDLDGNGYADRLYFGDMGGQVWRINLNQTTNVNATTSYYKLANLAGDTEATNRRFFYPPSVGLASSGTSRFLAVAIGSGYRAHPLNTVIDDHFYLLQDTDVKVGDTSMGATGTLLPSSLYNATTNDIGSGVKTYNTAMSGKHGWRINLPGNGEKVLSRSLIFNKQLLFNSYHPVSTSGGPVDVCKPTKSNGKAYILNLLDATPTSDINGDGTYDVNDRAHALDENTIPSEPQVVFTTPQDKDGDGKPDPGPDGCTNYTDFWSGKTQTSGSCTTIDRTYWDEQQ